MYRQVCRMMCSAGLVVGLTAAAVAGDEAVPAPAPPCPSYVLPIAPWATPSDTCHYDGYYVGGGCPFVGGPRHTLEGTWGWDYFGCKFRRYVDLNWCRCRWQGGIGSYETVGPVNEKLSR